MNGLRNYLHHVGMFSRNIWLFLLAALLMGVGRQVFQVLRNQYLNELHLSGSELTSVQGLNSLGTLVIAIPAIVIIGRRSARSLLAVVALVNAAAYAAQAIFGNLEIFRASAFCAGLAMGLNVALGAPFLLRNTSVAERVFAFSIQSAVSWPLSGFVGSWLSGWLQSSAQAWAGNGVIFLGESVAPNLFGYRFALLAGAAIVLLGLIPVAFIREGKPEGAGKSIKALLTVHNKGRLLALGIPEMIIGFGAGLTVPFFNVYFQNEWKLEPAEIAKVFSLMFVVLVATYLLAPPLIKRFGPVKVIIVTQILSLPFFVELALGNFLWAAIVAFIMRQTLMNLSDPVYRQFAQEVADPRDRNSVAVVVHSSRQLFFVFANFVSGYLIDMAGGRFTIVIVTTIVIYVVAIAAELVILPRLERIRRSENDKKLLDSVGVKSIA
ncbi:MAG: MFS transporter [Planctomycetes bacterium]|nr:MFS transporter [Planctomycetota bacterium]